MASQLCMANIIRTELYCDYNIADIATLYLTISEFYVKLYCNYNILKIKINNFTPDFRSLLKYFVANRILHKIICVASKRLQV